MANRPDIIEQLEANPSEENWKKAREKILKEGKYYYTFYPDGVQGSMSLKGAYVIIYDKNHKNLYKIPISKKAGKKIEGATWYLKGLEINRSIIKD
ncbi:MAG: hypothetical protein KGH94_00100 [Candidatus Micrarchaeota archaeon]|nr:hypothetical protein [Candidatus Micrarchaeota archaeon]